MALATCPFIGVDLYYAHAHYECGCRGWMGMGAYSNKEDKLVCEADSLGWFSLERLPSTNRIFLYMWLLFLYVWFPCSLICDLEVRGYGLCLYLGFCPKILVVDPSV